jgi:hypothetical protein
MTMTDPNFLRKNSVNSRGSSDRESKPTASRDLAGRELPEKSGRAATGRARPKEVKKDRDAGRYEFAPGGIYKFSGEKQTRLTNFLVESIQEVRSDNGESVERFYKIRIENRLRGVRGVVTIPDTEFDKMQWPTEALGLDAIVFPYQGAEAATAIKLHPELFLEPILEYTHSGWRQIGSEARYLHNSGSIGKDGNNPTLNATLPGALSRIDFREVPTGTALRTCILDTLAFLECAPDHIMYPLFSSIFVAAMGKSRMVVHLQGPTQSFKTSLARIAQQFFGREFGLEQNTPLAWSSTEAYILEILHIAKDTLLLLDDYVREGGQMSAAGMESKAANVIRSVGNTAGRGRADITGAIRQRHNPRALPLSTGEETPAGQSIQARMVHIKVSKGDVRMSHLTNSQVQADEGVYEKTLGAFLGFVAADYEALQSAYATRVRQLQHNLHSNHMRVSENLARLAAGFECFLRFAMKTRGILQSEAEQHWQRFWNGLAYILTSQERNQLAEDPVRESMRLLKLAVDAGEYLLTPAKSAKPTRNILDTVELPGSAANTSATPLGYVDEQTGRWWLTGDFLYAEVLRLMKRQGNFNLPRKTNFLERLVDYRIATAGEEGRHTVRRTIDGEQLRVIEIDPATLVEADTQATTSTTLVAPQLLIDIQSIQST